MGDIICGEPLTLSHIFMHILIGTNERVVCVEVDQNEALSEPTKVKDYLILEQKKLLPIKNWVFKNMYIFVIELWKYFD